MKLKNFMVISALTASAASVTAVIASVMSGSNSTLNGAGATFPAPLYQRWFQDYARNTGNMVNYQSVGSGAGVRQFIAGTVDFAASDEPIKASEASKVKRGVVQFPAVGGTIAVAYNKSGCTLKLTQKQLVDIFQGDIKDWNQLPNCGNGPIRVVHRTDASGTTFAFTNSLNAFDSSWKQVAKSVNWPVGVGGKGNEGVAGSIRNTPGSIGYVNTGFIKVNNLQAAAIQNKAGQFVLPTAKSGSIALNSITLDRNLAGEDANPSASGAYPISTLTWILAYKSGNTPRKAGDTQKAFNYILSDKAQKIAGDLGYVPLTGSVLNKSRNALKSIGQ